MHILNCLTDEHDLKYLGASLFTCCVGSVLFVTLMARARSSSGVTRVNWILLSGIVGGCMIWTTHFAAMVGYSPSIPHSYDPYVAAGTLLFAIASMTAAVAVLSLEERSSMVEAAGLLIGMGMVGIHALGMVAYNVQATVEWSTPGFLAAAGLAAFFGVLSTNRLARPACRWCIFGSMAAMMMGLFSMHFVAMSAMTLIPDSSVHVPVLVMSDSILMLAVLTIMSLLLVCGWTFYVIDTRSEQEARIRFEHLEHHDPLTGLANRAGLSRALEKAIGEASSERRGLAVLYFDIRRFRNVNNVHGYAAGDEMLRTVTKRIVKACGDRAIVARVGGDEFVAVVKCQAIPDVTDFARALIAMVSRPVVWRGKPVVVETNVGISIYPGDGKTAETLVSKASIALGRARNEAVKVAYHDLNRDEAIRSKSEMALDLRQAIERGEFELHYQRQNSAATRELVGFEVLLRWNHPEKGLIPPSEFIPIAEAYGYISTIGEWVLRTACIEAARWAKPYKIAVNVAPEQLSNPNLPEIVADALLRAGLPASRLELEMTESGIVADPAHTRTIIDALKDMGVSLAMDDYGTGNSSLSTLQNFPFDKIKIDKSFVTQVGSNPQAAAIIRSTIILGKSLKIPILAEGVETECALKYLRRIGCTEVQGFLFGKPAPASALTEIAS
jgi:diguanylate cyclase (GGDEF)-like protein